jgi:membrane-associated phospholipid phosphatase
VNLIERFDQRADAALERVRGHRAPDTVMSAASELGDFSLIWHLIGMTRGITSDEHARQALLFSALIGAESLLVNQGIKRLFRRTRPTEAGDPRLPVRKPSTSSFPSGHASAAFFAATLLTLWDGIAWAPLWFGLALVVGTSRAYVRIHHPSDVVGGAGVGIMLALLAMVVVTGV